MKPLSLIVALTAVPAALSAQNAPLSSPDSTLIGRIIVAEDRRDSSDVAFAEGTRHADARVRVLAQRARGRISDSLFASRDSLPALTAPKVWPEPAWRLRYRALNDQRSDCGALRAALADSAWPVRLRATDLAAAPCTADESLVATFRKWIDELPKDAERRKPGGVSWHAAAHAIVALARLRPDEARGRVAKLATHRQWQVRMYAVRAAAVLSDTLRLRALARDANDNVKEVAIESVAKLTGHAHDDVFLAALRGRGGAQAVRAAAIALKGSPRADVRATASATFERWVTRANASERDVRVALLEAARRLASDDRPPVVRVELPPQAVALALGADVRLRVSMASSSGGGSFVVRLRGDVAPMMAARILALARAGYYDGLTWHRVEHDFVIQGGSRGANEYVGWRQFLRDELGTVPHVRGTVGMSTRGHDTGDAQWFVNLRDNLRLARDYTVFAEVVEGIDVVDGILEGDVISSIKEARGAGARLPSPPSQSTAGQKLDTLEIYRALGRALRPEQIREISSQFGCHDGEHPCRTPDGDKPDPLLEIVAEAARVRLVSASARPLPPCPWGYDPRRPEAGYRVEVSRPAIRGDTAQIIVVNYCDNPPGYLHDVFGRDDVYVFVLEAGSWQHASRRMIRITIGETKNAPRSQVSWRVTPSAVA